MSIELAESIETNFEAPRTGPLHAASERAAALHREGRSAEAHSILTEALQEGDAAVHAQAYLAALRHAVVYAEGARRPDLVLAAASMLRTYLESLMPADAAIRDELSDILLLEAEMAMMARAGERALAAAHRAVQLRENAFRSAKGRLARARLIDALIALVRVSLGNGDDAAAARALAEAEGHLPARMPVDAAWQARATLHFRLKAAFAQRQNRHADAAEAFAAALSHLPSDAAASPRDANAARLQLFVALARSRLALGQGAEMAAEAEACHRLLAALEGAMPDVALNVIRAAVLANDGAAHALLNAFAMAEEKLAAALDLIDRLGRPDLRELRRQILEQLMEALTRQGRAAEAAALLAPAADPRPHEHDEQCGCGHAHDGHAHPHADGSHAHDNDHHHHAHGAGCSCCSS
jgi:hypothetical protein